MKIMKIMKQLLFLLACIIMLSTCTNSDVILDDASMTTTLKKGHDKTVSVPLKSHFSVWNHTNPNDRSCGEKPIFKVTMIGEGNMTHLGKMNTTMTFCNDTSNGEYWDTDIIFIAANGDELYASIPEGKVIPNEEENSNYYSSRFNDKMYFNGGTGRFEDASGEGWSNAYVHRPTDEYRHKGDEIWRTDFFSYGTLILKKGKR